MKTILFKTNPQNNNKLLATTESGKFIFLHKNYVEKVKPGECWECETYKELEKCIIVVPVRKVAQPKTSIFRKILNYVKHLY